MNGFDSIVLIGYGAPDKAEDVPEFLRMVSKGFSIPETRIKEVESHYAEVGGGSPLNALTQRQGEAMRKFLKEQGVDLPVYMAMRNWHPFTDDTIAEMSRRGHGKCAALIMALHQCDTSWERYQREVEEAKANAGTDIEFLYCPPLFDNPLFIENCADRVSEQIAGLPGGRLSDSAKLIFTAHSIPLEMPGSDTYEKQFRKTCELTARKLGADDFLVAWQSRSGSPAQKWFEPDICDVIEGFDKEVSHIVVQPIGFVCDHVEVLYDIGVEAAHAARKAGIEMLVAKTVNDDAKFARAMGEAVLALIGK
ncbi:MAG: ferrochelatase [Candidatus Mycalebacterium zealandia]|nr:MAG: ferrochelatase [Candidatus Mycalebacterium zealandia]